MAGHTAILRLVFIDIDVTGMAGIATGIFMFAF